MQIQILSLTPVAHPTKVPGKTTPKLDIAYKNLSFQGKVEGKGLFSFGSQEGAYKALLNAVPGEVYDIERVKEGEFQNWVAATKTTAGAAVAASPQAASTSPKMSSYQSSPAKSSYPTDEERAKTQIYIVRQSNLTAAINLLSTGAKAPPKLEDIIATAKVFENHVFGSSIDPVDSVKPAVAAGHEFDDLDDMPV